MCAVSALRLCSSRPPHQTFLRFFCFLCFPVECYNRREPRISVLMPPRSGLKNNPTAAAMKRGGGRIFRDMRASATQVTADQLIAQAQELQQMTGRSTQEPTKILLMSATELALYQQKQRAEFEFNVKRCSSEFGAWTRYAKFEEEQRDAPRLRRIFERCVEFHGEKKELWRQWSEAEMRLDCAEEARSVLSRAVRSLPQCDELWLKALVLEQAAHRDERVRQLFVQWMVAKPPAYVWKLAIQFELARLADDSGSASASVVTSAIRDLLQQLLLSHNTASNWIFYAGVELRSLGDAKRSIEVLRTAIQALPRPFENIKLHLMLAEAHEANDDVTAAREILQELVRRSATFTHHDRRAVFDATTELERRHSAARVDDSCDLLTISQARIEYITALDAAHRTTTDTHPGDDRKSIMDVYASLVHVTRYDGSRGCSRREDPETVHRIVDLVETACTKERPCDHVETQQQVALLQYLSSVAYDGEACENGSPDGPALQDRVLALLQAFLSRFPHDALQNPDLWVCTAQAILRSNRDDRVALARKVMGAAISKCGERRVFESYIDMELNDIAEHDALDRVRRVYQAWLDKAPLSANVWVKFAEFEASQGEDARCDGILSMGVTTLTRAASEAGRGQTGQKSLRAKYAMLEQVDELWRERLRHSVQKGRVAASAVLYSELVREVLQVYFSEFDAWQASVSAHGGPRPSVLDSVLNLAVKRLQAAIQARWKFVLRSERPQQSTSGGVSSALGGVDAVREQFRAIVAERRATLEIDLEMPFHVATERKKWLELSLSPVFNSWMQFESQYGTPETLQAVGQVAEPPKKKARLFKS